jgi:hypothetical protein
MHPCLLLIAILMPILLLRVWLLAFLQGLLT